MYHVPYNICHVIRVLHTRYTVQKGGKRDGDESIERGRAARRARREEKKKKKKGDEAGRKSSGNEALSFSRGPTAISLTFADLPAYHPRARVRE